MSANRRLVPVVIASVAVVAVVVTVLVIAVIPFPEFLQPVAGQFDGRLAFVNEDNCINVADLASTSIEEVFCETDASFVEQLSWTDEGIGFVVYTNTTILRFIDPDTGAVLSTETVDAGDARRVPEPLASDVYSDRIGDDVVLRDGADIVLRLTAPDRYWVEHGIRRADGLYAITDSQGRLAVFRVNTTPVLIAEGVRGWGAVAWEPVSG